MSFVVGQSVWVESWRRDGSLVEYTIEKVGRKWVWLKGGYRFDPETMCTDTHNGSPVYRSVEEHALAVKRAKAWGKFKREVDRLEEPPLYLIVAAAATLGIELEES